MNMLKDSLFSPSRKGKTKRNYKFHQANNSLTDPLLYTFENNDIELGTMDSDEESTSNNEHSIRTRYSKQNFKPAAQGGGSIVIVEKPILPNETIQAFSIRYRVPISQLKRLNNLQNDQDFYALTSCRIPVQRFGVLHEASSSSITVDLHEQSTISLPVTHLSQQNHHAFLNAMDQDLALMRTKVEQLIDTPSSTILNSNPLISQSLSTRILKPTGNTTNELNCDEADCGFRLWHIIMIIIVIALIPFIFAYFYIKSLHNRKI
ncbi:unnamed protein product [Adineta steineri]|uniref:LysM domain-containing protein n=1 Tax=Adineta steineri TaxID=433720 RepID=A0A815FNT7_9BILA|nr:unnamed protein product [Adineta steineri]CAF1328181.1 unnamed protein product [Adineta steineri]